MAYGLEIPEEVKQTDTYIDYLDWLISELDAEELKNALIFCCSPEDKEDLFTSILNETGNTDWLYEYEYDKLKEEI